MGLACSCQHNTSRAARASVRFRGFAAARLAAVAVEPCDRGAYGFAVSQLAAVAAQPSNRGASGSTVDRAVPRFHGWPRLLPNRQTAEPAVLRLTVRFHGWPRLQSGNT